MNHPVYGLSSTRNIQLLPLEAQLPSDASGEISVLNAGPPGEASDESEEVRPNSFPEEESVKLSLLSVNVSSEVNSAES